MAQWESKREQKKQERDARVLAAHRAHPDLADADARLSKHALDCVKRSLHGDVTGCGCYLPGPARRTACVA